MSPSPSDHADSADGASGRAPLIAGVARVSQDPRTTENPLHLVELMTAAATDALTDTGGLPGSAVDLVAVVGGLFRHPDPGREVADAIGATGAATLLTTFGGNTPIALIAELADRIRAGEIDTAVVLGAETNASRRAGIAHPPDPDLPPAPSWGASLDMGDVVARDRQGEYPIYSYPVIDSSLRAARGETVDAARDRAARTWAGFARVAVDNPHAADRSGPDADAIRTPGPDNRMVAWPYTKAMCANNTVDRATAIVLTSQSVADASAVPDSGRVYPHLTVTAADDDRLLRRPALHQVPALAGASARLLDEIGGIDEIEHLDLYGCFPSIVAITTDLMGIDDDRQLTQTGGLGFAGAVLNNAAGESLAAMVETLRGDPGSSGLVQGNGGHATKHALGVYSTEPPAVPYRTIDLGLVTEGGHRLADADAAGSVVVDGYTVAYDHDGPDVAVLAVRFEDGCRTWANSRDPELLEAMVAEEFVGRVGRVDGAEFTATPTSG